MQVRGRGRLPGAFLSEEEFSEDNELRQAARRAERGMLVNNEDDGYDQDPTANLNDYSDNKGPLTEWLQNKEVKLFIRRQFSKFIRHYRDENDEHVISVNDQGDL